MAAKGKEKGPSQEILNIVEDLNTAIGPDPAIPTSGTEADVVKKIAECAKLVELADEGVLKAETWEYLKEAGMLDHLKRPEAAPKGKRTPPTPPKRYTRQEALVDAINTGETNVDKIAADADSRFVKEGGKTNIETSKADLIWLAKTLKALDLAEYDGTTLTLKK